LAAFAAARSSMSSESLYPGSLHQVPEDAQRTLEIIDQRNCRLPIIGLQLPPLIALFNMLSNTESTQGPPMYSDRHPLQLQNRAPPELCGSHLGI